MGTADDFGVPVALWICIRWPVDRLVAQPKYPMDRSNLTEMRKKKGLIGRISVPPKSVSALSFLVVRLL